MENESQDRLAVAGLQRTLNEANRQLAECKAKPAKLLTMNDVMKAICDVPGCPMLTSNQCWSLAMKLNEVLK